MLLSTQLPLSVDSWMSASKARLPTITMESHVNSDSGGSNLENDRCDGLPPPPSLQTQDDNLYSASTTRKRKISKMWETVYGTALPESLFGHHLYSGLGRTNEHDNRQPQKELRKGNCYILGLNLRVYHIAS